MAIQFENDAFVESYSFDSKTKTGGVGIPDSANITGIEIRLARAHVINNRVASVKPFFKGFAQLYVIEFVVSDVGNMLHNIDVKAFHKVGDGEDLPIDKTLYYWKQSKDDDICPSQIHILTSIVKSKQKLRNVGSIMADIKNDSEFGELARSVIDSVTSGNTVVVANLLFSLTNIVGRFLGKIDDNPLITWVQSFTDLKSDWDTIGITKKAKSNDFALLELDLIVRDRNREMELAKAEGIVLEEIEIDKMGYIA